MTYLLEIMNRAALRPNGNLFFPGFFFFCHFFMGHANEYPKSDVKTFFN